MSNFSPIDNNLCTFGKVHSRELASDLRKNLEHLYYTVPVGGICAIASDMPGCPNPNPNIWQVCDGSEITNPNSPIRSLPGNNRFTPNLTNRYIRLWTQTVGQVGQLVGSNEANFHHSHSTSEVGVGPSEGAADDKGNPDANPHSHSINGQLGVINVEPPAVLLKFYMRIQ